ncbi:MAG TPA: metallophosphoesterase [Polyangiaceae bacterium]
MTGRAVASVLVAVGSIFAACGGRSPLEAESGPEAAAAGGSVSGGASIGGSAGSVIGGSGAGGAGASNAGRGGGGASDGGAEGGANNGGSGGSAGAGTGAGGTAGDTGGSGAVAGMAGGAAQAGTAGSAGTGGDTGLPKPAFRLVGTPLIYNPGATGFSLNAVLQWGSPSALRAYVYPSDGGGRREVVEPAFPADDSISWRVEGLEPGTRYAYEVTGTDEEAERVLYRGEATTQRAPGDEFTVALITDSHIQPRELPEDDIGANYMELVLEQVAGQVRADAPDFIINLGDLLDYHAFGFNPPPPDPSWSRLAYLTYRRFLHDALGHAAHFPVIGNWDGESGCNTAEEIERSRSQRLLYSPGPMPGTYPEGASPHGDYYAFTWGDALFVVLNVMTYTPTCHLLSANPGLADDWTLGDAQLEWLRTTLENATSKWRFTFIHHTVGGNGGNPTDSAYGRGGGRAAYVGEQALIHELLLEHGVQIFFYGHDHVFEDMVVDGVHYTLPGSAGAPWKFSEYETGYEDYWVESGHARLNVGPEQVRVDFVSSEGTTLHSYTLDGTPEG